MEAIILSIPIFFILIAAEFGWGLAKRENPYRLNDTFANIGCGIGQQVTGLFFKGVIFSAYIYLYLHFRWFTIPSTPLNMLFLFLGVDFFYYWFHRLSHEVNWIWATHIVHHQSEEYNLSVALRQSWFQGLISWVFYIPLALVGFDPTSLVLVAAFNTLYQFWIHTKFIKNLGPLEWILNTPSHHRVHHGSNPQYIDKNHAGTLIIWDRLFGTFQAEEEEVVYGITTPLNSWNPIYANFHYWGDLWRGARPLPWREKLRYWQAAPGWRPALAKDSSPVVERSAANYQKFDTTIPVSWKWYGGIQFLTLLIYTSFFLFNVGGQISQQSGAVLVSFVFNAGLIIGSMHVMGLIFEGKASFVRWEYARLALIAIGGWAPWEHWFPDLLGVVMVSYAILMYLWLRTLKTAKT